MASVIRTSKEILHGYSHTEKLVRRATSQHESSGPDAKDMAEIARRTYNGATELKEILDMLLQRLNSDGRHWRHVLKSLLVLDRCLRDGSELVVTWARRQLPSIRTLSEFYHIDEEDGRDVGASIRANAKALTFLLMDEDRLRAARADQRMVNSRLRGIDHSGQDDTPRRKERSNRTTSNDENDLEYRLALEASMNEADADAARRKAPRENNDDDDDLAKAIKLSEEEEELRRRAQEDRNQENLLFDDTPEQAPQPTGFNQGYQQQAAVDWFGNPVAAQQQAQPTGYLNNAYSQPTGVQPQSTGFQNGFGGYGYQQAQPTGYEHMQQPQQQFLQPQNTSNPWAQQTGGMQFGSNTQAQQPLQEQPTAQPGSNNPWASNQPSSPVISQPTGSNNPFAAQQRPLQHSTVSKAPTLSSLSEQRTANNFNSRPNPIANFQAPIAQQPIQPQQTAVRQPPPQDPYAAKLNSLLASGEGQDTFGNVGDMRIPAQHTAPGTFVNSAGAGSMGRLEASKTGHNPFYSQQSAAQVQYPAQTGPAGPFGQPAAFGGSNPFGSRPPQQQQQQQGGQSGSLIDL